MTKRTPSKIHIPEGIAADIGSGIVSGRLKPGVILDGEIVASGERDVSRSAYREAIRVLTAKGLVRSRPKTGTRVTERGEWNLLDPDVLNWTFAKEPPRELLVSLFELRELIEPEAAALAAARRTRDELFRMGEALDIMERETLHTERGRNADETFHNTLLSAAGNPYLTSISSSITAAIAWSTMYKVRTQRLQRDAMPDHIKVYKAVATGDRDGARAAMIELIELAFSDATELRQSPRISKQRPRRRARSGEVR